MAEGRTLQCGALLAAGGAALATAALVLGALLPGAARGLPLPEAACCADSAAHWDAYGGVRTSSSGTAHHEDIWSRLRQNLRLSGHLHRAPVRSELDDLVQHLPSLFATLESATPYLHYVVEEVEKRNMPAEVALLPLIESKYQPYAHSIYGATGIWQFMPETARHYGLRLDWWADDRRNLQASTQAALDYIEDLAARFNGDWLLALAAYNTGQGRVARIRDKQRQIGLSVDFWSLELPRETRRYVPSLLALAEIIRWGQVNGYSLPPMDNRPALREVATGGQSDLLQLAEMADLDVEEFFLYNAGHKRWATPPEGPHVVLLPLENADLLEERLARDERVSRVAWDAYLVKPGDTLTSIAERRNTSVAVLRQLNDLYGDASIRSGQNLLVPQASEQGKQVAGRGGALSHEVKPGQTLQGIAGLYGVPQDDLAAANRIRNKSLLRAGATLHVPLGPELPEEVRGPRIASYRVRSGDSLSVIARRFKTSVDELIAINSLTSTSLYPGWELRIPLRQEH